MSTKAKSTTKAIVTPPQSRMDYTEFFSIHKELGEMQRKSFLCFVGGKKWMRLDEWEAMLKDYLMR